MSGHSHEHGHSHGHSHGHDHSHGHAHDFRGMTERALWVAFWLNFAFLLIEVFAGLWSNSLALLSDAGHMVSDVAALLLALFAERLSRVRPSGSYTFGLKRVPILGAFGNALTLLAIVAIIFWEAWHRFRHPPAVQGLPVLIVGGVGLLVNLVSAWWLHRSESESLNVRGAMLHLLADALGSLGAMIAAVVLMTTGWRAVDALVSVVIGLLILLGTWPLLRDSVKVLLQAAPSHIDIEELREKIEDCTGVQELSDFHVWELNSGELILSAVLLTELTEIRELEELSDYLRESICRDFKIEHATFEWRTRPAKVGGCVLPPKGSAAQPE